MRLSFKFLAEKALHSGPWSRTSPIRHHSPLPRIWLHFISYLHWMASQEWTISRMVCSFISCLQSCGFSRLNYNSTGDLLQSIALESLISQHQGRTVVILWRSVLIPAFWHCVSESAGKRSVEICKTSSDLGGKILASWYWCQICWLCQKQHWIIFEAFGI